jgi:hypothetical protein
MSTNAHETPTSRQERWNRKRLEIIRERRERQEAAELAGMAYVPSPYQLPMEPPAFFEAEPEGQMQEVRLPANPFAPDSGTIPGDQVIGLIAPDAPGERVVPGEVVASMISQQPAPPRPPERDSLAEIDSTIARLTRRLRRS